jgi:hypothetical protein
MVFLSSTNIGRIINELKTRHKTYLISGILRENQAFLNGMAVL